MSPKKKVLVASGVPPSDKFSDEDRKSIDAVVKSLAKDPTPPGAERQQSEDSPHDQQCGRFRLVAGKFVFSYFVDDTRVIIQAIAPIKPVERQRTQQEVAFEPPTSIWNDLRKDLPERRPAEDTELSIHDILDAAERLTAPPEWLRNAEEKLERNLNCEDLIEGLVARHPRPDQRKEIGADARLLVEAFATTGTRQMIANELHTTKMARDFFKGFDDYLRQYAANRIRPRFSVWRPSAIDSAAPLPFNLPKAPADSRKSKSLVAETTRALDAAARLYLRLGTGPLHRLLDTAANRWYLRYTDDGEFVRERLLRLFELYADQPRTTVQNTLTALSKSKDGRLSNYQPKYVKSLYTELKRSSSRKQVPAAST